MSDTDAPELLARLRQLPGCAPLLHALAGEPGVPDEAAVYLVGGAVRDLRRGGAPLDLDLVVVGEVGPLAARLGADVRPHERFGTATVHGAGGVRYDLAQARRETYPTAGALPEVAAAGIDDDLQRRDFTVNALALGLTGERAGRLRSVAHGLDDLAAGRLRVLHPASFRDDPTRLLRLARYAARLRFTVEPSTAALVAAALEERALSTVSGERVGRELALLAAEADPVAGFSMLRALGIDEAIAPGFGLDESDGEVARRALALLGADGDPVGLVLGLALRGVDGAPARTGHAARLGLAAPRRDAALAVARDAEALAGALRGAERPSQVDAALRGHPPEAVAAAGALIGDAHAATRAGEWLRDWRHTALAITGDDLIAAGIPQGPRIAAGLRAARAARLDGHAADREAQLARALRAASGEQPPVARPSPPL